MQGYREIGGLLTHAREERSLTIGDVAKALHIRPRYIQALEDGNFDAMPNLTYMKGYLRRYAMYLTLDMVEILRRFDIATQQDTSSSFFMPHSFSHEKRVDRRFTLIITLFGLFLMLMWALWVRPDQRELPLVEAVPEKVMEQEAVEGPVKLPEQVTCLQEQKSLYPPCHWPQPEPETSIMMQLQ